MHNDFTSIHDVEASSGARYLTTLEVEIVFWGILMGGDRGDAIHWSIADKLVDGDVARILIVGQTVYSGTIDLILTIGGTSISETVVQVLGKDDQPAVIKNVEMPL